MPAVEDRKMVDVRRDAEFVPLSKAQFRERFMARFYDPAFESVGPALEQVFEKAWDGYHDDRKSPRTRPRGRARHSRALQAAASPRGRKSLRGPLILRACQPISDTTRLCDLA